MLSVVIAAIDNEQRAVLQVLVDGTGVARTVHTCATFPVEASDPVMRRVRAANPDVLLVDIPSDSPAIAMRAIELLRLELPDSAVFGSRVEGVASASCMTSGERGQALGQAPRASPRSLSFSRVPHADSKGELKQRLARYRQIKISVTTKDGRGDLC